MRARNAGLAAAAAATAAAAAFVQVRTARVEQRHRLLGRFVEVDGTTLHYLERGEGPPLVMLHGLGAMVDDLLLSGLVSLAARRFRVLAFDRPGHGRSTRPRDRFWTPTAQAEVLYRALRRLDIDNPAMLGHSYGATVALAYALRHPVERLTLVSGYYYPSVRLDAPLLVPPAIPLIGDLLRYTLSPLLGRALWPAWLRLIFGPRPVPRRFRAFPTWLALRPSQLRAVGEDAALLLPAVTAMRRDYSALRVPTRIVAGEADRYVSCEQSQRLHADVPGSELTLIPAAGHMAHYAAPEAILAAPAR